jgi:polysaccharide biosynthesis/export protein
MIRKTFPVCAMIFLLVACLGTAAAQDKSAAASHPSDGQPLYEPDRSLIRPVAAERYPRYLLRASDVLQISFPISPEYDQTVSVQPDGYISLRGVGDLYIAGKSLPELTEALRIAYQQFLHQPVINIELKDFEKPYFIAGGQFGHPGKYELRGDTTVAEAVAIAGGFTEKAKHSDVVLYRRVSGGWAEPKKLNMKQMLNKGLSEDVHLRPGDLVYVPQNTLSKIKPFIPNPGIGMTVPF